MFDLEKVVGYTQDKEGEMNEWRNYEMIRPVQDLPILIIRGEGVFYAQDFHPEMNIAGLMWKPTGIYRTEMDAIPPEVRSQREIHVGLLGGYGMDLGSSLFGQSASQWRCTL